MVECPFCDTEIEEKYVICPSCDQRIRCEECDELLLAGKDKCYVCGEPIHTDDGQEQGTNTFHVEEERDEDSFHRSIDIEVSDEGIQEAARIANHFFGRGARREIPKPEDEENVPEALPPEAEVSDTEVETGDSEHSTDVHSDEDGAGESAGPQEDEPSETETSRKSDIDIRKIDYNYEKVMLALYDLTEREAGDDAVPPIEVYKHLEETYGRNTLSKKDVRTTIAQTNYRGEYFEKSDNGGYYLTVNGVNNVESWINNGYGGEE